MSETLPLEVGEMETKDLEKNGDVYQFPEDPKEKVLVNERKGINRKLIKRLLASKKYSYVQIANYVGCTDRHVRRIRDELIEADELTEDEAKKGMGLVAADFDEECIRSTGESYLTFIQNKRKKWKPVFAFVQRVWKHVWDEPSIYLMLDRSDPTGGQLCQKFIDTFGSNKKRIRDYKKFMNTFLVFIGRGDLQAKYMTMSKTQDPEGVREVPQIEFIDFPLKLDQAISAYEKVWGTCEASKLKFKITSGIRSGDREEERGWAGFRKKEGSAEYESYITFNDSPDDFVCSVLEKQAERWRITWIPPSIRTEIYKEYQNLGEGDPIVTESLEEIRKRWYPIADEILGFRLELHDFRKIYATWLIILGVPFMAASKLNVGWADLNTLNKNYNQMKSAWRKSDIQKYRNNIPNWFKEELEEFVELGDEITL
jgi:hypothetical protein